MKKIRLFFFCFLIGSAYGQQSDIDSLRQSIKTHTSKDSALVDLYTQIGNILIDSKQLDQVLEYGNKANNLSKKIGYRTGLLNSINILGKYHQNTGSFPRAINYFEEYIEISEEHAIVNGVMQGNNNLAQVYFDKGEYPKALKYNIVALTIAEKHNDFKSIPIYYSNVARVYYASNQYEKAIEYTEKALKIEEENNASPKSIIIRSVNLSAYYTDFGFPEKSVTLLKRMLLFNEKTINNATYAAYMYANLGDAYIKLDENQNAVEMILLAYPAFEGSDRMRAQLDLNLAHAYANLGQKSTAHRYLDAGLAVVEVSNEPEFQRFAYETASFVYKNELNFKSALKYHEMASVLKDSLLNAEQSDKIVSMQTLLETRQKEDSIALQQVEIQNERNLTGKALAVSAKNKAMLNISLIALVIVCVLAFIVVRLYKRANKQKQKIKVKSDENELLLGEIHHRVKNNLQVISSLLALQERSITDESAKAAIMEGRERVQSIGLIHKHLYQNNNFSSIEMRAYISNLINGLVETLGSQSKPIRIELDVNEHLLDVDKAIPLGLIINELIVNAIKYAYEDIETPILKVSLKEENNETILGISDNGNGSKTDVEQSKKFGMKLIRSLARQLGGKMDIEENNGLQFSIAFKLDK